MPCVKYSEGQLSDYTDGALPLLQTARVRRHLRRCECCTRDVAALQRLNHNARLLYTDAVPAVLPSPVRLRRVGLRPLLAAGVAAVAAAVWFAPEMPGRQRVAFADVENAMRQVKTVHWQGYSFLFHPNGKPDGHDEIEVWVRMKPRAVASRFRRHPLQTSPRNPPTQDQISLITDQRAVVRDQFGDWSRSKRRNGEPTVQQLIDNVVFSPSRPGGTLDQRRDHVPWQSTGTADGLMYFKRITHYTVPREGNFPRILQEVWADPRTYRLTRRVNTYYWTGTERIPGRKPLVRPKERVAIVMTESNFRYNEPLPAERFQLQPPPDAKVAEQK